jgi:hypothetical protein
LSAFITAWYNAIIIIIIIIINGSMFPHGNIHKQKKHLTSDGKTLNLIDYILIDKRRHPSRVDV